MAMRQVATCTYAGIETRYCGPTNYKGSRIRCSRPDDPRYRVRYYDWDCALDVRENHERACVEYMRYMDWHGRMVGCYTKRGYVFAFVKKEAY